MGSVRDFGVTVAGEWSVAINSCAMFLNGVDGTSDYQGDCAEWESSAGWTQATKDALRNMALASMDGLRDYFFWTWKVRELFFYTINPSFEWFTEIFALDWQLDSTG